MNSRDLARILGVSHTTVTLALNNNPRISEAMRQRVREAAERHGYHANALVSALMSRIRQGKPAPVRGEVLAYLSAERTEDGWRKLLNVRECVKGAERQAGRLGYRLEHFWMGYQGANARQVSRVLRARAVRGAMILTAVGDSPGLLLDWEARPVVSIGYGFRQQRLHQVANNHVEGVKLCYQKLRSLGCRRIALSITKIDDEQVRHYWWAGFLMSQQLFGGDLLPVHILSGYDADEDFGEWLRTKRPDAIIGTFPNQSLKFLHEAGVRVPEEVMYASLDIDAEHVGEIAGIRQDWENTGAAMVDVLAGQISANEHGLPTVPKVVLIDGRWVPGKTVRWRR
ncbi:LacI family transcriptional regulator [Opitutaceae bacterium TAV5]|nr:LacI family transcriptional regulator [Opitutaceae bacterium TAV5]